MKRHLAFGFPLLLALWSPLAPGEPLDTSVRVSICLHPEDEGSDHKTQACPSPSGPVAGHPFRRLEDNRSANCQSCAAEHRDSPELCRISEVRCAGLRIERTEASSDPEPPVDDKPIAPEPPSRIVPRITLGPSGPSGAVKLIQNSGGGKRR